MFLRGNKRESISDLGKTREEEQEKEKEGRERKRRSKELGLEFKVSCYSWCLPKVSSTNLSLMIMPNHYLSMLI